MKPARRMLAALGVWCLIGLLAAFWSPAGPVWRLLGLLFGAVAAADLLLLARTPDPQVRRRVSAVLPQRAWSPVDLSLTNRRHRPLHLDCHDLHPGAFEVEGLPRALDLGPRRRLRLRYRLRPARRGRYRFGGCELRLHSPLRLWTRLRLLPLEGEIRVYPDFAAVSGYRLLAAPDRLAQMGVRRAQRRGSGSELHQLREYRHGDAMRQIDWKATSRTRRLIAREYQEERNQRLLFLLDSGRRMRHLDEQGHGHLDEALNALLLLASVAVRQGDAVGLMTYGGPPRWFPPRKDPDTVRRLLAGVFDLEPGLEAADPLQAARELMQSQPRRALVVFVTNSRDEDHPELLRAVRVLRPRHLVLVADLRESTLDRTLDRPIEDRRQALRFHGVHDYLADRRHQHERLHHVGALVLDLLPRQLPLALVDAYLAIKRSALL